MEIKTIHTNYKEMAKYLGLDFQLAKNMENQTRMKTKTDIGLKKGLGVFQLSPTMSKMQRKRKMMFTL